ncbi:MAG: hypothetical protein NXI22_07900 [bacterium]|nr:hypothetical protein [bacterium]
MQRIDIPATLQSPHATPVPPPQINEQLLRKATSASPVSLFCPLHYEPNYAYPLLVWIDSAATPGRKLQYVMPEVSMRNYVGAAAANDRAGQLPSASRIVEAVQRARSQYNINPRRIFIAGYADGGGLALQLALQHANLFAAGISLGGPFPDDGQPLINLKSARETPLMICQGRDSVRYPDEETCRHLRLFHAAGMQVTLRQYACGDEFHPPMLDDANRWLMEHINNGAF